MSQSIQRAVKSVPIAVQRTVPVVGLCHGPSDTEVSNMENKVVSEGVLNRGKEQQKKKEFSLHVGGTLKIPGWTLLPHDGERASIGKQSHVEVQKADKTNKHGANVQSAKGQAGSVDHWEGLPLRRLAEYLGERAMPALESVREEEMARKRMLKQTRNVQVHVPHVPHLLPCTRWAAQSPEFRATLVVDAPPQRPRLSWYHPDDIMVPRDWFRRGLLDDLKYYSPFGMFSSIPSGETSQA